MALDPRFLGIPPPPDADPARYALLGEAASLRERLALLERGQSFPAAAAQETWKTFIPTAPWTSPSNALFNTGSYFKDSLGFLHLAGSMTSSPTAQSAGSWLFTLPVGYRPAKRISLPTVINGATSGSVAGYIEVYDTGLVTAYWPGAAQIVNRLMLDGLNFRLV